MIYPDSNEAKITEQIMDKIKDHIRTDARYADHYADTFEMIYDVLRSLACNRCGCQKFSVVKNVKKTG
jgi:hypothetical protein